MAEEKIRKEKEKYEQRLKKSQEEAKREEINHNQKLNNLRNQNEAKLKKMKKDFEIENQKM